MKKIFFFLFIFLLLTISLIAISFIFLKQININQTLAQPPECSIGNCISCHTQEDCLNAGCEWDIQGFCVEPAGPPPPPPPGPGPGECTEASAPFEWGTIIAEVSGNQVTIYNTSAYAWAVHRTIRGCPPPVYNEPPTHQPDDTDLVYRRLDGGGWVGLTQYTDWLDDITCAQTCTYSCCQNTYDLSFALSGLSAGNHVVDIRVRGQYPSAGDTWEYITAVVFTILPPPNNPPNIPTLIAPPHNTWINYNPTFQARISDPDNNNVRAYFNVLGYGDGWGSWVSSGNISFWGPRNVGSCFQNWWRAYAKDTGGLTSDWTGYWLAKVDKDLPSAGISYPTGTIDYTTFTVSLSESDACSGIAEGDVDISINGGAWQDYSSTLDDFNYTGSNGSSYQFRYRVRDNAGNWSNFLEGGTVTIKLNNPPTATPQPVPPPNCCSDNPAYFFSWIYSDPDTNPESRFEFQVDNNSGFGSPEVSRNFTGLSNPSPSTNTQAVLLVITAASDRIIYGNITYYWRVKVYDSLGANSGWVNGSSFITPSHHYPNFPDPYFTWLPYRPSPDEQVQFSSSGSMCYDQVQTGAACVNILNGGDDIYYWDFVNSPTPDGDATPAQSSETNPKTKFRTKGAKPVTLTITDSDGYSCTASLTVLVRYPLPKWREVGP